ncbi:MAG: molybdenum cofactor guanylyltransferase [Sulfobacillus sp.]
MDTSQPAIELRPLGAVLVGGQSVRMGQDKATLPYGGKTLAEVAADRLAPWTREVLFIGGPGTSWPGRHLADIASGRGPLAGVAAALREGDVLVMACDLPHVPPRFLAELLATRSGLDGALYLGRTAGIQPLVALYRQSALAVAEMTVQSDRPSMEAFVSQISVRRLDDQDLTRLGLDATIFTNVNHPDDYRRLVGRELDHA